MLHFIMKTIITKQQAKSAGVGLVKSIAMPLHMAGQLATNVMQLATDGIALGEGYVVNKIDNEQVAWEVASSRVDYTKAKFMATAMALEAAKCRLKQSIEDNRRKSGEAIDKIKEAVMPAKALQQNVAE